jgi:uncharacterized protein
MRIAISGASGLIGTAVAGRLEADGHVITRLVRSREAAAASDAVYWGPARGAIDEAGLAGHDVVVNLAGENIFGVWTAEKKRRIRQSRVEGTRLLAGALARLPEGDRPGVLINASAVGYYGGRPMEEPVTEASPAGGGFMADVVRDWEAATGPARDAGVRVVLLRFAPVMDADAVPVRLLGLATRLGVGATIGSGRQPFPWVTRDEIAHVVPFVLARSGMEGPVNVAAPDAVTNREFTDTMARVLGRPRFLQIPTPAVRLLGDLGDEFLGGARVLPARLDDAGYQWRDPKLEPALRRMLTS